MNRDINKYFFDIAKVVALRSTCNRSLVGAIVVKNKNILATGYNGSSSGLEHCIDVGCELNEQGSCIRTVHAEQNAIIQAAKNGVSINNAIMYVTLFPCYTCAKIIINAGIKEIYVLKDYHSSQKSKEIFKKINIKFKIYEK